MASVRKRRRGMICRVRKWKMSFLPEDWRKSEESGWRVFYCDCMAEEPEKSASAPKKPKKHLEKDIMTSSKTLVLTRPAAVSSNDGACLRQIRRARHLSAEACALLRIRGATVSVKYINAGRLRRDEVLRVRHVLLRYEELRLFGLLRTAESLDDGRKWF